MFSIHQGPSKQITNIIPVLERDNQNTELTLGEKSNKKNH